MVISKNPFALTPTGHQAAGKQRRHVEQTAEAGKACDFVRQLVEPRLDVGAVTAVALPFGAKPLAFANQCIDFHVGKIAVADRMWPFAHLANTASAQRLGHLAELS